jgi:hypothetical protein
MIKDGSIHDGPKSREGWRGPHHDEWHCRFAGPSLTWSEVQQAARMAAFGPVIVGRLDQINLN